MSNHSHSESHKKNRRDFLKLSTKLAALGVTSLGVGLGQSRKIFAAESATTDGLTDYKALVCLYMFGGNDGNNMIVPVDLARYTQYQTMRAGLALTSGKLLASFPDGLGGAYALHYGMPEINTLYGSGEAAFVFNVGQLNAPLSKAEYQAGQKTPTNLFSHSDQIVQAQTAGKSDGLGWGGRLLDCCGVTDTLAAVSMSSPALFLQGQHVAGNVIPQGLGLSLSGMNVWQQSEANMRKAAVDTLLTINGGNEIRKTANRQMADGLQVAAALKTAGTSGANFSFPGTSIGNQLKDVANLIQLRSTQGPGRQVFFVSMDGFDLHSGMDWNHWYLLSTLSLAVSAFNTAVKSMDGNMNDKVTLFTQSEFGRTMQPSGSGADHAWGNHQMVVGGAVKAGVYGAYPTLAFGGPDDASNRGVWIPKISTAQYGATLGKWFGAKDEDLAWAFGNLDKFSTWDLGFMKTS